MLMPPEPPPIFYSYQPIIISQAINSVSLILPAIYLVFSFVITRDPHPYLGIFSPSRFFRSILIAFFGKKRRGGARSQHIKPGIQYQWDEDRRRWVPVLKRPPSIVTYKPSKPTNVQSSSHLTLRWPLDLGFIITQDFQGHLKTKAEKGYKYYNGGLDLAYQDVREGADVTAAAAGILKSASFSAEGYGYVVYIDHLNGYVTIYAHLSGFGDLSPGHAVEAGDIIGQLGHSGNCWGGSGNPEGTHLHFELRYLGKPVDPMPYLS